MNGNKHDIKIKKMKESDFKHFIEEGGMPIRKGGKNIGFGKLVVSFNIKLSD